MSLGAASIHFAVIVPHLDEYLPFGVFFLSVAWFQAIWAVFVMERGDAWLLILAVVVNVLVVVIWVWSRTLGLPIGPEPGAPEQVGAADSISTALEAVIIGVSILVLARPEGRRDYSRRFQVVSALVVWGLVIVSSVVAIVTEANRASVGHAAH